MITTARLQRRLRKTNAFLRVARIVTAGLLIVFVGIGVTSAVQRNLLVSVLSFLLALVCAVALSFSIMILRGLPSLNERLGDPDKAQHPTGTATIIDARGACDSPMSDLDSGTTTDRFVIIAGIPCAVVGVLIARPWSVVISLAAVCGAAYRLWRRRQAKNHREHEPRQS